MEDCFKRFLLNHLAVPMAIALSVFYFGTTRLVATLAFVGLIEATFYYLDARYLPNRKSAISSDLIRIFHAEPVSDGIMKFQIGSIDIYTEAVVDFKLGLQIANIETIMFHVPRNQIHHLSGHRESDLIEGEIEGIATYGVYQTDGSGLKDAKEELEKMI